jgi:hypothetical protein
LRLAFEREELEVLKSSPELLMLTPQAARLAEASQTNECHRLVSLTPQDWGMAQNCSTCQNLLRMARAASENSYLL